MKTFLERAALKILGRAMKDEKPKREIIVRKPAELLRPRGEDLSIEELEYWRQKAEDAEAELAQLRQLERIERIGNITEMQRERLVRYYLQKIEELNLTLPGGLRSQPLAEEGEDQALVNEAYLRFCERRRGGGRFGG